MSEAIAFSTPSTARAASAPARRRRARGALTLVAAAACVQLGPAAARPLALAINLTGTWQLEGKCKGVAQGGVWRPLANDVILIADAGSPTFDAQGTNFGLFKGRLATDTLLEEKPRVSLVSCNLVSSVDGVAIHGTLKVGQGDEATLKGTMLLVDPLGSALCKIRLTRMNTLMPAVPVCPN